MQIFFTSVVSVGRDYVGLFYVSLKPFYLFDFSLLLLVVITLLLGVCAYFKE